MAQPREDVQKISQDLAVLRDDIRHMADELRLKVHLAGMEAKDAWRKLEPRISDFEHRAERAAQDASSEIRAIGRDLKASMNRIRDSI